MPSFPVTSPGSIPVTSAGPTKRIRSTQTRRNSDPASPVKSSPRPESARFSFVPAKCTCTSPGYTNQISSSMHVFPTRILVDDIWHDSRLSI
ncbi:hypothetical protein BJX63DRAFT_399484 [Aspergillus granulosus]|uniref:Uncharacterized protein n=1 Tax=Aspergillus granulosus TaxID=176169 RepID=A0ABR4H755_9EURO